ncbi:MAG TPA: SDR family oxidoreductase [Caulobacteraceae bacterium]|jgi:NAD(P)-dependent dehydrogenase (short-subunit alcohol dehydrogenase family)|nr:SDR family oxidoreductase [Caulobacteraceae bacterium]
MPTALITGASRGIGLGLTRAFCARGWSVVATCRDPAGAAELQALGVRVEPLDVTDFAAVDALAARLKGVAVDALVANAGIAHRDTALGSLDYAAWRRVLETNLIAPVKLAEAFLDHVLASDQRKIVGISSSLASVAATNGGNLFYRTSKTALNMAYRTLAMELQPRGATVVTLSPGYVDTDLTRDMGGAKVSVETSAQGLVRAIEALTPRDTGRFFRYTGETIPW